MSNWVPARGRRAFTIGLVSATTEIVSVTSGATSSTPGAWVTIGQFPFTVSGFNLYVQTPNVGRPSGGVLDIGLGDGSTTIVESLISPEEVGRPGEVRSVYFPIRVPSSVAVVARFTVHATLSVATGVALTGFSATPGGGAGYNKIEAINVSTSGAATTIEPAANNTKGTAVSMTTGGLSRSYKGIYLVFNKNVATSSGNNRRWFADVLSGTEQLINDIFVAINSGADQTSSIYGPYMMNLAAGTPMSIKVQCQDVSGSGDRLEVALYGIM